MSKGRNAKMIDYMRIDLYSKNRKPIWWSFEKSPVVSFGWTIFDNEYSSAKFKVLLMKMEARNAGIHGFQQPTYGGRRLWLRTREVTGPTWVWDTGPIGSGPGYHGPNNIGQRTVWLPPICSPSWSRSKTGGRPQRLMINLSAPYTAQIVVVKSQVDLFFLKT